MTVIALGVVGAYLILKILAGIVVCLAWRLNSWCYWLSFIKLRFTDSYQHDRIDLGRAVKVYQTGNWFARRFIEALDRKYNYGLIKHIKNLEKVLGNKR